MPRSALKRKFKKSAAKAKQQLDQVLLSFQHSGLKKLAAKIKKNDQEKADLIGLVSVSVLRQADSVRESLKSAEVMHPRKQKRSSVLARAKAAIKPTTKNGKA